MFLRQISNCFLHIFARLLHRYMMRLLHSNASRFPSLACLRCYTHRILPRMLRRECLFQTYMILQSPHCVRLRCQTSTCQDCLLQYMWFHLSQGDSVCCGTISVHNKSLYLQPAGLLRRYMCHLTQYNTSCPSRVQCLLFEHNNICFHRAYQRAF